MKKNVLQNLILILLLNCLTLNIYADTLYDKRFKRWQAQAEKGNAYAQYSLGNSYLRGNEVKVDIQQAIKWFEAAAKQDHSKSEYKLGYIYYSGRGIAHDYKKAAYWFKRAAEKNYAPAQYYMGKCFAEGRGVKRDKKEALVWLKKAKANDYSPAAREIENLQLLAKNSPKNKNTVKKKAPTVVAKLTPKPKPKPQPKLQPAPKKQAAGNQKSDKPDVLKILQSGGWTLAKKPAEHLPSSITNCKVEKKVLVCKTNKIVTTNPFAEITYIVESKFSHFNDKGEFMASYRRNNMMVIPSDPDDPEPNQEYIPKTGWTINTVMKCKVKSENKISCFTENFKKLSYAR